MNALNIGSFTVMSPRPWINIDLINAPALYSHAAIKGFQFYSMDVRHGLPFETNTLDYIFTSHMLEHVTREEAEHVVKECYRTLKPGGTIRISVPDLEKMVKLYTEGNLSQLDEINEPCKLYAKSDAERFWRVLFEDHKMCYDWLSMKKLCRDSGFDVIEKKEYKQGNEAIQRDCQDLFPQISLFVECVK